MPQEHGKRHLIFALVKLLSQSGFIGSIPLSLRRQSSSNADKSLSELANTQELSQALYKSCRILLRNPVRSPGYMESGYVFRQLAHHLLQERT